VEIPDKTMVKITCVLCKKPINDPYSQAVYDPIKKEMVYRHRDGYCQDKFTGYSYMRRLGQTKYK